jgi:GT2 family glycosyltransferase
MRNPLVISVILNSNRREDTIECLSSLKMNAYPNHQIIVLDNDSSDGSVEAIKSNHPDVHIIQLVENRGYAGNNNVGIQAAINQGAAWVFVINEDTIFSQDCLSLMIQVGETDPTIGILGPMVYHHDEPNVIQSAGGELGKNWLGMHLGMNEDDHGQFSAPHPVEWITGCAILVRREVIEQVGMIDEKFFIYSEEKEWCIRASKAGWKLIHVPAAKVWHKGVQRNYQPKFSFTYYSTRNHFLMLSKHHAPLNVWLSALFQTLRTLISWSIKPKWRHKREHRDAMWRGLMDFLRQRWGKMEA